MSTESAKVLLYARISQDDLGDGAGVERQLEDGRALAAARGWRVVGEYSDNDISALEAGRRPQYAALMAAATTGRADRIIVWHPSRLWRSRTERAAGIEALARHRVSVTAVKGPDLDLSTAYGRGLAGLLGEFDTMESEVKGERVQRKARERALEGRANGPVLYGWSRTYSTDERGRVVASQDVIDEEPAAVVREIVRRILGRESLTVIAQDLTRREVPPPGVALRFVNKSRAKGNDDGSRWGRGTVKKIAMRPANAGLRVWHRGQADEELLPAAWPALVERDEWETAVAILSDPARNRERPASRQHLLTWGIGECGVCGAHLRVAKRSAAKLLLYVCDSPRGCVGRSEAAVDDLVRRIAIARLARPDALDWLRRKDDGAHEAAQLADDLRARLDHAADAYAEGRIDARQLERITARLRPDLEDALARSRVRALTVSDETLAAMAGPAAEDAWRGASLAVRRAVLETLGMTVRIMPVKRRGPGFDPESVEIAWVQS